FVRSGAFKGTALYAWSQFWWIFMIYDFLRYVTLALFPGHEYGPLEFYLCDYGQAIGLQIPKMLFYTKKHQILIFALLSSAVPPSRAGLTGMILANSFRNTIWSKSRPLALCL